MSETAQSVKVPKIDIQHRLRIAREAAGMVQSELAEKICVCRNTVTNAETGKGMPRPITLKAWALATGVPVQWLLDGSEQ